jgi:nucleoside-diphosphate-sugar epimerase
MRKAIVTGATGFLGSNLVKRLISDQWDVYAISRHNSSNLEVLGHQNLVLKESDEMHISEIVASINPDVIYHLAASVITEHSNKDIRPLLESNVVFGTYLLEGLKECSNKNFINAGTFWQHYQNQPYSAVNLYAATKEAYEAILNFYVESYSINAITLKLFDNYGPEDSRNKLFTQLLEVSKSGGRIDMTGGDQYINLVYVDDVIESFMVAYNLMKLPDFNGHSHYRVASMEEIKLRDLVEIYQKILGRSVRVNWGAKPYRKREMFQIPSYGESLPGWEAKTTLEEGLKRLALSYQNE